MLWLILSLFAALFESLKDVFSKKSLKLGNADEYAVSFSLSFFSVLVLLIILAFTGIPSLGKQFWAVLLVTAPLEVVALILFMKAIKSSDLSVTLPMITFTPIFLLISSPIMLGEYPSAAGIIGILLIVAGSYVLNIKSAKHGLLQPFKALLKQKGPRLMLLVAFIWNFTANLVKIGMNKSTPVFWALADMAAVSIIIFLIMAAFRKKSISQFRANAGSLMPVGIFMGLMFACQMFAMSMAIVPYVIAVKRASAILGVFWGALIFRERNIRERLLGASIMVAGVVIIAIS